MKHHEPFVRFCYPKSCRLRKRADIVLVQRTGVALHSRFFVVVCNQGTGRLGITVSKKVGNAVVRNQIKRLVRQFVRTSRPLEASEPPWLCPHLDVVVIAKRRAAHVEATRVWSDLAALQPAMASLSARFVSTSHSDSKAEG